MPIRYAVMMLFGTLFLNGCITARPYPSDWPKPAVAAASGCVDLSGRYRPLSLPLPAAVGPCKPSGQTTVIFGSDASCASLPKMLAPLSGNEPADSWLALQQTADSLTVSYHVPLQDLPELLAQQDPAGTWPGRLNVAADGVLETVLLRGKDYECDNYGVSRILTGFWDTANIGVFRVSPSRVFSRAADGSLLLEAADTDYGLILLPPFAMIVYNSRWMLWQPLEKQLGQP